MSFLSANPVGVDIGAHSLKIVRLKGKRGSYTLQAAARVMIPGEAAGDETALSGLIGEAARSQGLGGEKAAAVIPGRSLITRHIYLPSMPVKDLKEAVKWELRKEIAFPANELVSDYFVSGPVVRGAESRLSIIAFAARRSDVEALMSVFKNGGLELRAVDAAPMALLNAFSLNNAWETGVTYAMVDIGKSASTFAIFKDGRLWFARDIGFGGDELTAALVEAGGREPEEAEEYKAAHGLGQAKGYDEASLKALRASLEALPAELLRSMDYYQAEFRVGAPVNKLFLSGGGARLKGIEEFMTRATGIASFAHDPLRNVKVPGRMEGGWLRDESPCLNVAAGLAARGG